MGEAGSFSPDGSQMAYTDIRQVGGQFFAHIVLARLWADGGFLPLLDLAEEDQFPAWSPDGKWVAFGRRSLSRKEGFGSQLMIYDPASGQLKQLTDDADFNNTTFVWSPSGDQILMHRFDLETPNATINIWVYRLSDGSLTRVVDNASGGHWLP
jgi:Tol biopolymer transport system component